MYRYALDYLIEWKKKTGRKPLIIRGARQVGKSYLVGEFAKNHFENLVELNFDRQPELADFFKDKNPKKTVQLLELHFKTSIQPEHTLLFLDEIQAAPSVIPALRYFYEELPDLHVIAAGSLLEFVLADHEFSMPVGRMEYLHLGPMQFEEFLLAVGEERLRQFLVEYELGGSFPQPLHQRLLELSRIFCVIGGMPQAVANYAQTGSFEKCEQIKQSILSTYQDDFSKYRKKTDHLLLTRVFRKVPLLVGEKVKYVNIAREERAKTISQALSLLCLAGIAHKVYHSFSNGVPLGAETSEKNFKIIFLDVGLVSSVCGLSPLDYEKVSEVACVNQGKIAEQFVGQHLFYSSPFYQAPELFCWIREQKNSSAEIDYVVSVGPQVVPIEVKAGKTGRLKSLHVFVQEKKSRLALRFNSEPASCLKTTTSLPQGEKNYFDLISLPFYLIGQMKRFVKNRKTPGDSSVQ